MMTTLWLFRPSDQSTSRPSSSRIPIAFNVFMNVDIDSTSGAIRVLPPRSRAGDHVRLRALMPLIVGMTACSAGQSNNFRYKPIDYRVVRKAEAAGEAV